MVDLAQQTLGDGRYRLGDLIGSGGAGAVRAAHDTLLDRPVAIKLVRAAGDATSRARMRAEAQLAGGLHHPGIAQVYDYGEDEDDSGALVPFIVMEHVAGTSLWHRLREQHTLPPQEVMSVVAQVADALAAAHDAGVVHRDLKPANLLLTPEGRVVVVDFGIARGADVEPLTATGTIVGTADYISPEQCEGHQATPRSDLYALGMVAYECLTGRKPFRRETDIATALAHLNEDLPPLPDDVPAAARDLVHGLVAKDPEQRPPDAATVAAAAAAALAAGDGEPLDARPRPRRGLLRFTRSRRVRFSSLVLVGAVAVSTLVAARDPAAKVPDLRGEPYADAASTLQRRGLEARRRPVDEPARGRDAVLAQSPGPGETVEPGDAVTVSVASGWVSLSPRDVVGKRYRAAARVLVRLGLVPERGTRAQPSGTGRVVGVSPTGRIRSGHTVTLTVAVPPG